MVKDVVPSEQDTRVESMEASKIEQLATLAREAHGDPRTS